MDTSTFFRTQMRLRQRGKSGKSCNLIRCVARAYNTAMDRIARAIFPAADILPAHWEHITMDRREQYRAKLARLARLEQPQ